MKINYCEIKELPKIADIRGNLSIIEQFKQIPFDIKRVHWIYDVPGGMDRGGHAFKETEEFIVALSGSFDVEVDDGINKKTFPLSRSYYGLFIPKGIWRTMTNFSTNSLAQAISNASHISSSVASGFTKRMFSAIVPESMVLPWGT